jgi:hypothetical protein
MRRAQASPMPRAPPVTTAVRPLRSMLFAFMSYAIRGCEGVGGDRSARRGRIRFIPEPDRCSKIAGGLCGFNARHCRLLRSCSVPPRGD